VHVHVCMCLCVCIIACTLIICTHTLYTHTHTQTHNEGGTYRMCSFKEGDTFAASYMKMFQTSPGIQAQIESAIDTSCIMITIPEEYRCVCVCVCVSYA